MLISVAIAKIIKTISIFAKTAAAGITDKIAGIRFIKNAHHSQNSSTADQSCGKCFVKNRAAAVLVVICIASIDFSRFFS